MGNCSSGNEPRKPSKGINIRDDRKTTTGKVSECKVVMLGDSAVGKSSIAVRYLRNEFSGLHVVTIGAQFQQPLIKLKNGNVLKVNLWDTTGEEKFRSMVQMYYREAKGAILVYDIGNKDSFTKIEYWLQVLLENVRKEDIILFLVGNKKDLEPSEKKVDTEVAQKFATANGMFFAEASAKTGDGINDVFKTLAEELAKKFKY